MVHYLNFFDLILKRYLKKKLYVTQYQWNKDKLLECVIYNFLFYFRKLSKKTS